MNKRFFIWKDAKCNGINPEWIEMSGKDFYAFKHLPENRDRKFVALSDPEALTDTVFLESTKPEYDRWHREESKKLRKKKSSAKYKYLFLSLDTVTCESSDFTFHDVLPDESVDIEDEAVTACLLDELSNAIIKLSDEEKTVVNILFLQNDDGASERTVARKFNIPVMTLHNRKVAVLKKIKKYLVHNC